MLYPQKGSIAIGSRRVTPTSPVAAAVVSLAIEAPTNTPCCQSNDSYTSGATRALRPPKINAEIGTPSGASHFGEILGDCAAGTVYRAFGCAAVPFDESHFSPFQLISPAGGSMPIPSHHGSRSAVIATFVKSVFFVKALNTFGFVFIPVPGATPKKPASGLIACKYPSSPIFIHAMSSPTVHTRYPWLSSADTIIARFVFPHALGKAAAMYVTLPPGDSRPRISMCSAIQPCSRAITLAIRNAKHFFPSSAFPP